MLKIIAGCAIAVVLFALIYVGYWFFLGLHVIKQTYHARLEGPGEALSAYPSVQAQYPGLNRTAIEFPGPAGNTLRGFLYEIPNGEKQPLMVLYHGYGLSLEDYLPETAYFCNRGYHVLAFDGSGTGYSDGLLFGLPRHLEDLKHCLDYLETRPDLTEKGLVLFGHSWGGYACNTVSKLGTWPIRGIVSAAGFATPESALMEYSRRRYGFRAYFTMLSVRLHQRVHFGRLSPLGSADGLAQAICPVLIAQSTDDPIVAFSDNYGVLYKRFANDPKKTFLPLEGRGHNITVPREVDRRKRSLMKQLRENPEDTAALQEFFELQTQTDRELLSTFADFFDQCLAE